MEVVNAVHGVSYANRSQESPSQGRAIFILGGGEPAMMSV
jgi:hypothetical protein